MCRMEDSIRKVIKDSEKKARNVENLCRFKILKKEATIIWFCFLTAEVRAFHTLPHTDPHTFSPISSSISEGIQS